MPQMPRKTFFKVCNSKVCMPTPASLKGEKRDLSGIYGMARMSPETNGRGDDKQ